MTQSFFTRSYFRLSTLHRSCGDLFSSLTHRNVSRFADSFTLEYTSFFAYSDVTPLRLLTPDCTSSIDNNVVFDDTHQVYTPFVLSPASRLSSPYLS